jgi:hypothetical protein
MRSRGRRPVKSEPRPPLVRGVILIPFKILVKLNEVYQKIPPSLDLPSWITRPKSRRRTADHFGTVLARNVNVLTHSSLACVASGLVDSGVRAGCCAHVYVVPISVFMYKVVLLPHGIVCVIVFLMRAMYSIVETPATRTLKLTRTSSSSAYWTV